MNLQELGARLKKARTDMGLTQAQVCKKIDIQNVQTLSSYEKGTTAPSLQNLASLSVLYRVSVDYFLFGAHALPQRSKEFYVQQLVDASDRLGLHFHECIGQSKSRAIFLELSVDGHSGLKAFGKKWSRLRELLDTNTITKDEYNILLNQRLSELKIKEDPLKQAFHDLDKLTTSALDWDEE